MNHLPHELTIECCEILPIENNETLVLTDEVLKQYQLDIDKTKIDNFDDINFVSLFEE